MNADLGIPHSQLQDLALHLNTLLADTYVLYTKTKNYHWNVTGPHFDALHQLFDEQAETMEGYIDQLAERVRTLGYRSAGTLKDFLTLTRLTEDHGTIPDGMAMVSALCDDQETLIRSLRNTIEHANQTRDFGTSDLLTGVLEGFEKMAWMLRSHRSVSDGNHALRNLQFTQQSA